jgi:rubrerythrin
MGRPPPPSTAPHQACILILERNQGIRNAMTAEKKGNPMMGKTNYCPNCNYLRIDIEFSTCPKCGIIIEKYFAAKKKREKPTEKTSSDENKRKT